MLSYRLNEFVSGATLAMLKPHQKKPRYLQICGCLYVIQKRSRVLAREII